MGQVRHIKKFMDGRKSPEQVHSDLAFPRHAQCAGCHSKRPITRAIVMMELKEAMKNEMVEMLSKISPEGFMQQCVQIKGSDGKPQAYFRCSVVYACKSCTPAMERQLAKAPSHAIVEINRGPGVDRVITSG